MKAEGQTILVIDKNLPEMATLVDRHYIVDKGRVAWSGKPAELSAQPNWRSAGHLNGDERMLNLPVFKAAAVQAAPVFGHRRHRRQGLRVDIRGRRQRRKLVAFPEVYISAYPYWSWVMNPVEASPWFESCAAAPSNCPAGNPPHRPGRAPASRPRGDGREQRSRHGVSTIYNTMVFISDEAASWAGIASWCRPGPS